VKLRPPRNLMDGRLHDGGITVANTATTGRDQSQARAQSLSVRSPVPSIRH
jgi:hypothetical protein